MKIHAITVVLVIVAFTLLYYRSCTPGGRMEKRVFSKEEFSYPLPYRLFVPQKYSSSDQYPLVLLLHGSSERGSDNRKQLTTAVKTFISDRVQDSEQCFVLAPQCPRDNQWLNTEFKEKPFPNYNQDEIAESDAMKMIMAVIDLLTREFSIDSKRIYVTGFSMGGSGSWDIILRYPDIFAAAVPITGVSDPSKAGLISNLPVWAFHGKNDSISSVTNTRNMIKALRDLGSDCKYTEYESIGHNSWDSAYSDPDLMTWLFARKKK